MWFTAIGFIAKISDPKIGGTSMTLYTTVSHLGLKGSMTAALWFHDFLTVQKCSDSYTQTRQNITDSNAIVRKSTADAHVARMI